MRLILILMTLTWCACSKGPQPISYGEDACNYCKMTIVDQQHSAEAVTLKGKVYKFDAIECLVHYVSPLDESTFSHLLVANYDQPGTLMDARSSSYLISPNLPSPMGAFLNAFDDANRSAAMQTKMTGELHSWTSLKEAIAAKKQVPQ